MSVGKFRAEERGSRRLMLLVSHAGRINLRNILFLKSRGMLPPGLRILALCHEKEYSGELAGLVDECRREGEELEVVTLRGGVADADVRKVPNPWTSVFRRVFEESDGLLLPGGDDIQPSLYGGEQHLSTEVVHPWRHRVEISLLVHLFLGGKHRRPWMQERPDYPVLGVCLGCQTLNVALGGTLCQDIPSSIYGCTTVQQVLDLDPDARHKNYAARLYPGVSGLEAGTLHRIRLEEGWPEGMRFPLHASPLVLSIHHQCVDELAPGLRPVAHSVDGRIIEAFRHEEYSYVLGLQFHPEKRRLWSPNYGLKYTPADTRNVASTFLSDRLSVAFNEAVWNSFVRRMRISAARMDGEERPRW